MSIPEEGCTGTEEKRGKKQEERDEEESGRNVRSLK